MGGSARIVGQTCSVLKKNGDAFIRCEFCLQNPEMDQVYLMIDDVSSETIERGSLTGYWRQCADNPGLGVSGIISSPFQE